MGLMGRLSDLHVSRARRYGAGSGLQNPATTSEIALEHLMAFPTADHDVRARRYLEFVPENLAQARLYDEVSNSRGEHRMKLLSAEIKLLLALQAGQSVVKGDEAHTLRQLIAKGYAAGKDASDENGDAFIEVRLSPSGREIVSDLYTDE